jgi:hypothetical protein
MLNDAQLLLHIIKLVLGGFSTLFAILLFSKTRDLPFVALIIATMGMYAGIVYDALIQFGIVLNQNFLIFGIPFSTLFFTVVPALFFLIALLLLYLKYAR